MLKTREKDFSTDKDLVASTEEVGEFDEHMGSTECIYPGSTRLIAIVLLSNERENVLCSSLAALLCSAHLCCNKGQHLSRHSDRSRTRSLVMPFADLLAPSVRHATEPHRLHQILVLETCFAHGRSVLSNQGLHRCHYDDRTVLPQPAHLGDLASEDVLITTFVIYDEIGIAIRAGIRQASHSFAS